MAREKQPDPNDREDDALEELDERTDPKEFSLEDRVKHLETIVNAFLTAHGETYTGALDHNETLAGVIASHH